MIDGQLDRPMARPVTPRAETVPATNTVADGNRLDLPMVSSPRRSLGRDAAKVATVGFLTLSGAALAASLVTGNDNLRPTQPAPTTQEGQAPIPDTKLQTNIPETQTGDPTIKVQEFLKSQANEYYSGTISFDNLSEPTFTVIDPEHPNNQQLVSLDQIDQLCGQTIAHGSHVDPKLTNALIVSNRTDGTMKIIMDGMVGNKPVVVERAWDTSVKVETKGLFGNSSVTGFDGGEPMATNPNGSQIEANQIDATPIDDQPNPAPVEP